MGSGSSSAQPSNTVVVQPATRNQTSFSPEPSNDSNNSVPPEHVDEVLSRSLHPELELDSIETAKALPRAKHEFETGQESTSRNSQQDDREKSNAKRQRSGSNDEITFEVYHSHADGKSYTVINNDGSRFYLDSWTTGEWQPLPGEWLNYGYIEQENRNALDCVSTSDAMLDDAGPGAGTNDDDKMGVLRHPLKGELMTYMMDTQCHVHCVFDPSNGVWLKLPLSWELHSPSIKDMISQVQQTLPAWSDKYEMLALLRQCNYSVDDTIATYLALLDNGLTCMKSDTKSDDFQGGNDEMNRLRMRIEKLEKLITTKNTQLEETLQMQNELEDKLRLSESVITKLQDRVTCIQKNLEDEIEKKNIVQSHEIVNPPLKKNIAPQMLHAVTMCMKSLAKSAHQIKQCFTRDASEIQTLIKNAILGMKHLSLRNRSCNEENTELRKLYHKETLHRKLLYNKLQELRGNIRVFCRCRFDPEVDAITVKFPSDQEIQARSQMGEKTYMFDRIFPPSSTQKQVFEDTLPLIASCVDGYSVCIMAYGQTGSGKTYTMMGTDANPGVNIRSIQELLRICNERKNVDYMLTVSMLEVYNETLRDLLGDDRQCQLTIQMKGKAIAVNDLTEIQVNSADSITKIMEKGNANRSIGETKMNTNSSRSHLLLILRIKGVDQISHCVSNGTLTLVDLAGSERISKTEATGQRLVEAAAINKSLSALGQVFTALRTNAMHIPYRNSKLTQLLQVSLGGDGKACLFINISPAEENLKESLSTLNFGSVAKQVQLGKVTRNIKHY